MKRAFTIAALLLLAAGLGAMGYFTLREDRRVARGPVSSPAVSSDHALEITDANFEQLTAGGVVLVDFWAPWCPPCRSQGPIVDQLAARFAGRAVIGKLNVDQNRTTAKRFGISSIPTLIIFVDGGKTTTFRGLQKEAVLAGALEKALSSQ